jgi:hypothetical protein
VSLTQNPTYVDAPLAERCKKPHPAAGIQRSRRGPRQSHSPGVRGAGFPFQ